jgi:hypothetical protein
MKTRPDAEAPSEPRTERVFERSKRPVALWPLTPLRCVRGSEIVLRARLGQGLAFLPNGLNSGR